MSGPGAVAFSALCPGIRVQFVPWLPDSNRVAWMGGDIYARDERSLLWTINGIHWHEVRGCCPTWTDAAGCRCDVEGA